MIRGEVATLIVKKMVSGLCSKIVRHMKAYVPFICSCSRVTHGVIKNMTLYSYILNIYFHMNYCFLVIEFLILKQQ